MTCLITYVPYLLNLRNTLLVEQIKKYENWAIISSTCYIISGSFTSVVEIRNQLGPSMRPNDKLIVTELTGNAAWRGFNDNMSEWLKKNL